jgi:LPXTG-motif cell wall-anchored protein
MRIAVLAALMLLIPLADAISEEQAKEIAKAYLDIGETSQQYRVAYEGLRYWGVDAYAGERRSFSIALQDGDGAVVQDEQVLRGIFQGAYAAQAVIKAKNFDSLRTKVEELRGKFETSKRLVAEAAEIEKEIDFSELAGLNDNVLSAAGSLAARLAAGAAFEANLSSAAVIDVDRVGSELETYADAPADASELAGSVEAFVDTNTDKRLEVSKSNSTNAAALLQLLQPPLSKTDAVAFRAFVGSWNASFASTLPEAKRADADASIANFNDRRARKEAEQAVKDAEKAVLPVLDAEASLRACGLISEASELRQKWNGISDLQAQHSYAEAKQSAAASKTLALSIKDSYEKQCGAKPTPTPVAQQQNYLPLAGVLLAVIAGAYYFWKKRKAGGIKVPEEQETAFGWRKSA